MRFIIGLCLMASVAYPYEITDYNLPESLNPDKYELNVITHMNNSTFDGVVHIKLYCGEATYMIILHSRNLTVDKNYVSIVDDDSEDALPVSDVSFIPMLEFMNITLSQKLKPGKHYRLTVPFAGHINDADTQSGYFKDSYVDKKTNQTRWLAVTNFKSIDARQAFPCFDEPQVKSVFKIRIGHQKDLTAVSNMRLIKTTTMQSNLDYVLDEFEESPLMSTYLVAYMVSDFTYQFTDICSENEIKFRFGARRDEVNSLEIAKTMGPPLLQYFENYFGENFSLPKIDIIAIPRYNEQAMESWGLITFEEMSLLNDPAEYEIWDVNHITRLISEQLARQWLGNLVTPTWWNEYWLNEGLAIYLSVLGVDTTFPEWHFKRLTFYKLYDIALYYDSQESSHPLMKHIKHPDELQQFSDPITQSKGSCLMHMINMFLSEETFKQGLRYYINKNHFSVVTHDDLWHSLTKEAHREGSLAQTMSVKKIMDTWTLQAGYPLLNVKRNYSTNTITLSQNWTKLKWDHTGSTSFQIKKESSKSVHPVESSEERYMLSNLMTKDNKSCWWIPITMTTSTNIDFTQTKAEMWLNCKNKSLTIRLNNDNDWVIFNLQYAGLVRVLYDTRNLMAIISTLNDKNKYELIHESSRVQLIKDTFALSESGEIDYCIAFQLLNYLKHEKHCVPWQAATDELYGIRILMRRTPNEEIFKNYMQQLLSSVYDYYRDMTVHLKNREEEYFKYLIIFNACRYEKHDCIVQALTLFRQWMQTENPDRNNVILNNFKLIIYKTAIKHGDYNEWKFMWKRYLSSNEFNKYKYLEALGCSSDTRLLYRLLHMTIGDNPTIPKDDALTVFSNVANGDNGFHVVTDFLNRNVAKINASSQSVSDYVQVIGNQINTKEGLKKIQAFIKQHSSYLEGANESINKMIEDIKIRAEWNSKYNHKIVKFTRCHFSFE